MTGSAAELDVLIQGLLRPEAYDHRVDRFEVLETHISWVILTGDYAYKLKKPVNFGFVDFSTLEKRRFCCEEELRLNRRQADDLYLAVRPIYGPRDKASFLGDGAPMEFAVQMRQFSQDVLLPAVLERGELTPELLDRLAADVAKFQQQTGVAGANDSFGTAPAVRQPVLDNFTALLRAGSVSDGGLSPSLTLPALTRLRDWSEREFVRREQEFERRKHSGKVREGHGDMHAGNMVLRRDRIEVFDCLEFNPSLRWIDVISEVAFLVMDLADRGRPDLGWRFLNGWLEQTGDYEGLCVWAWYYCYRALVRAKVAVLRRSQADISAEEAKRLDHQLARYLELARQITQSSSPCLIITCGVSGTGKSYWTQRLAAEFGFVRLRSDVERKRLFGQSGDLYSAEATNQTYARLKELSAELLDNGQSVIVDATFLKQSQRRIFRELAEERNVPCCLLEFRDKLETLRRRIGERQRRGGDPSDATISVLEQQIGHQEVVQPEEGWHVIDLDTDRADIGDHLSDSMRNWREKGSA